jgi:periplasmic protein TonB
MIMQANILEQLNAPESNVYEFVPRSQFNQNDAQQSKQTKIQVQETKNNLQSSACLFFVILAHICAIFFLAMNSIAPVHKANQVKTMLVSLISPQAPEPELVTIVEPTKPVVVSKPKLRKLVEKNVPIEKPAERLVEATTELSVEEEKPSAQSQPIIEAEAPKVPQNAEPIVEDKIEPPRFGVAYLNNPAPEYPAFSRRVGEEGRVVMKVLVSADGAADEVQIEKSSGSDRLDNAAVNAVKKWRFIPAKKNNQPLSAYVLVPMKFSLDS